MSATASTRTHMAYAYAYARAYAYDLRRLTSAVFFGDDVSVLYLESYIVSTQRAYL